MDDRNHVATYTYVLGTGIGHSLHIHLGNYPHLILPQATENRVLKICSGKIRKASNAGYRTDLRRECDLETC
jgi:hypothetical protein